MKTLVLIVLNLSLVGLFVFLFTRRRLLTYHQNRQLWLTWLSVAIITLMDEFTDVFFAPAESYRFIGAGALVFIALTSLLMRFMSTRYTEIAEILEKHNIIGGGVYSFSYFVLGPTVSFIAVASIMVDYTLTACISSVAAIGNAVPFTPYAQGPDSPTGFGPGDYLVYCLAKHRRHQGQCQVYLWDLHPGRLRHVEPDSLRLGGV